MNRRSHRQRSEHPRILVFVGAGPAYKYVSLLGKVLCQLAIDGSTVFPIDPFSSQRPAPPAPAHPALFHYIS